jgi:hypothetical protein
MTGFSEEFTHAGGAQPRNPELTRNLYAALITYACNLGYAGMADASGISEDAQAWTAQWYLRQDRAANTRLVNAHHRHPLASRRPIGCSVVLRRAALPAARPQPNRSGALAVLPRRRHHHLHPRLRPALHLRHQGHPHDLAGSRRGAG